MFQSNDDKKLDVLSQDLLVYITHLEKAFNEIEESEEKTIIQEWLLLILENPNEHLNTARIRNMALSELLMNIEQNKLRFPFNERPSLRSYGAFVNDLMSILNQNSSLDNADGSDIGVIQKSKNHEIKLDDFDHIVSADNRTYVAIRSLPNNSGVFGYVAVTIGDGEDAKWLDSKGCPMATPVPTKSDLPVELATSQTPAPELPVCSESEIKMIWLVLKTRRPEYLRKHSYEFFKTLYATIVQEMIATKDNPKCNHPFIDKLLKFLEIDMKVNGVTDTKLFCRIKKLSILKKQVKNALNEIENRTGKIECVIKASKVSPVISLSPRCCYNFVSSAFWNEISLQRPSNKYMDILSCKYPQYLFPKYFAVLMREKQHILTNISSKYCRILNEMFSDLGNSIAVSIKKYRDAKWEWHLAHDVIDAYLKERAIKDNLCPDVNSVDNSVDSFFDVILNEIDMAQKKLKSITIKNNIMAEQLPKLKNEIEEKERTYKLIVNKYEDKLDKYKKEINYEKRDIMKRENTIAQLQKRAQEVEE